MEVDEVRYRIKMLERNILDFLVRFEADTGCRIVDVRIGAECVNMVGKDQKSSFVKDVTVEVTF